MKAVIQRVVSGAVFVKQGDDTSRSTRVGAIGQGLVVLLGIDIHDDEESARKLADKIAKLRLFVDPQGKMNWHVKQAGGAILVVSQFTLLANTEKGNRPSFKQAMSPEPARLLYDFFCDYIRSHYPLHVEMGCFGADMRVVIEGDGPVTIVI